VVYWDADDRKDLLIGRSDGTIQIFLNIASDNAPSFDGGSFLQVGPASDKVNIDVGSRATPTVVDWDNDGKKDLVVGAIDGRIRVFINEGTDGAPDFATVAFVQADAADLVASTGRSSPVVADTDADDDKDLLTGNTEGQLLLYANSGSDAAPAFAGFSLVEADGLAIDLPGLARSRPCACDWTFDGLQDVLIGGGDGKIYLYQGVTGGPPPVTECSCPADLDDSAEVDAADLAQLLGSWGECPGCPGELSGDGMVDAADLAMLLGSWGACP